MYSIHSHSHTTPHSITDFDVRVLTLQLNPLSTVSKACSTVPRPYFITSQYIYGPSLNKRVNPYVGNDSLLNDNSHREASRTQMILTVHTI